MQVLLSKSIFMVRVIVNIEPLKRDHWNAIQPLDGFMSFYVLMTGGRIKNNNGVF